MVYSTVSLPFFAVDWSEMLSLRWIEPFDWSARGEARRCAAAARGDTAGRDGPGIIFISLFPGEKKRGKKGKKRKINQKKGPALGNPPRGRMVLP